MTSTELKKLFKQARRDSGYKIADIERIFKVKRGTIYYCESEKSMMLDAGYVLFLLEHTNFPIIYGEAIKNAEETV